MKATRRFRLSKNETIKANLMSENGKLLASIYDSGFTTKDGVFTALCRKTPFYGGNTVDVTISTEDGKYIRFTKKVNQ